MNILCQPYRTCGPIPTLGALPPAPGRHRAADLIVGLGALLIAFGLVFRQEITWLLLGG